MASEPPFDVHITNKASTDGIYFRLSPRQVGAALVMYTVALAMLYWSQHDTRWELRVMRMQMNQIAKAMNIDISTHDSETAADPS